MLDHVRADLRRYAPPGSRSGRLGPLRVLRLLGHNPELWMILLYRYGRWAGTHIAWRPARFLALLPCYVAQPILEVLLGIHIAWDAQIGKGLYIGHFGSVWIGPVTIGENCNLAQEVTIGEGGRGEFRGLPRIGDRVWIGPGAKIFGRIEIGNDVAIGANSVVSKSVPDKAVVVGNPGRVVGFEGSAELLG